MKKNVILLLHVHLRGEQLSQTQSFAYWILHGHMPLQPSSIQTVNTVLTTQYNTIHLFKTALFGTTRTYSCFSTQILQYRT